VAVADTSIQNLQSTIFHLEEEKANQPGSDLQLETEKRKAAALKLRATDRPRTITANIITTKGADPGNTGHTGNTSFQTCRREQETGCKKE
jgi:hypothetical protein